MSLNDTPSGERIHIGFFGLRNAGKSSLVNAVTGQDLAVVSDTAGTTTDPVKKAMELLPLGPVMIVDTPGLDDVGELGGLRVAKAKQELRHCDMAVLVVDGTEGPTELDRQFAEELAARQLPHVVAYTKADLLSDDAEVLRGLSEHEIAVSAVTGENIHEFKELLGSFASAKNSRCIVADLLPEGAFVVLVTPLDGSAPKGRLILPQQMTMRDLLDAHIAFGCCQPEELASVLEGLKQPPALVITDSQAFGAVSKIVPEEVPLTSFSILMARYKGSLDAYIGGAAALAHLQDGDEVLIAEGCTHHRQCADIGTVKMPAWIEGYAGCKPRYSFTSGGEFPEDLSGYKLVVHCGGCTLNEREMAYRLGCARSAGVPIVNYGMAIAQMHGILKRSLQPVDAELASTL